MRDRIAIGLALLVVLGIGFAGWQVLRAQAEPDPLALATAAVDDYVAAWSDWGVAAMEELVREPDQGFATTHSQMREALMPAQTRVTHDGVRLSETSDAEAFADVHVELDLPYADTFAYDTTVRATRVTGEWKLHWEPATLHPELREEVAFQVRSTAVDRAPILGQEGAALTGAGEVHVIGFEPRGIDDADALVVAFERTLPDAVETLTEELARDDLVPTWFYPVATVSAAEFERVWTTLRPVPGVLQRTQDDRVLHSEGFTLHVLGVTEEIDAERAAELGTPYEAGDVVGRYGLEAAFEDQLTGGELVEVVLVEGSGEPAGDDEVAPAVATLHTFEGDSAEAITTTLDVEVQQAVENALVGVAQPAAMVVLDAGTGAIRASASRPLTGENRAFLGAYPPGSTFKVVTATALLRHGTALDSEVECPEEAIVGGLRIGNAEDLALGPTTFIQAFANSCNTTFARLAADVEEGVLADAAARFGFRRIDADGGLRGAPDGVYDHLPLEAYAGSFPPPIDAAERGAAAFGQGRVQATPLHMATVAAAAASGTWRPPFLVEGRQPDGAQELDPAVVDELGQLMAAVVADGSAADAGLPTGVAGKTGSAEFDQSGDTHAWFIGYRDGLALSVFVEQGGGGGAVAAPIAARFFAELDALTAAADDEQG